MLRVSGILGGPKAYFGRQLWGHPLYAWGLLSQNERVITLWKKRLRFLALLFDIVRLDHASGFFSYCSLDPTDPAHDTLEPGPGFPVFKEIITYCHMVRLRPYAEGIETKAPKEALAKLRVGAIRIFRFAYNEKINEIVGKYANIASYPPNTTAYTALHDTEPLMGYLVLLTSEQKKLIARIASVGYSSNSKTLVVRLREAVVNSPSRMVIIPIQDWLLTEDRINIPGTEKAKDDPNWHYRLSVPVEQLPQITF